MHDKLTQSDIDKIQEEIDYRKLVVRPQILEAVKEARAQGDLSENFEYYAARREKGQNDSRIRYLENMIKTAKIIDEDKGRPGGAKLYDRVTLWLPEDEEEMIIQVVSTVRTNPNEGLISLESPLGKAVLGAKVGDLLTIRVNESYSYDAEVRAIEEAADDGSAPLLPY